MKDLVIKGGYGLRNFGDDALMYYLIKYIKRNHPEFRVTLDCKKSSYIGKLIDVNVDVKDIKDGATLLFGGGTLFYHFPVQSAPVYKKIIYSLKNPKFFLRWLEIRFKRKINYGNVIMLGVGFGPFYDKSSSQFEKAKAEVLSANYLVVRDAESYSFSKEYNKNTVLGTDICFADIDNSIRSKKNVASLNKKIAVVLRDWDKGTDMDFYVSKTYPQLINLRKLGYDLDFLMFSDQDVKTLSYLQSKGEDVISWNPDFQSIEDFMGVLSNYDLIISSRFHGLIFSTIIGLPSIGINIEPKISLAKENAVVELWDPFSNENVTTIANDIFCDYDSYKNNCKKMVEKNSILFIDTFKLF